MQRAHARGNFPRGKQTAGEVVAENGDGLGLLSASGGVYRFDGFFDRNFVDVCVGRCGWQEGGLIFLVISYRLILQNIFCSIELIYLK